MNLQPLSDNVHITILDKKTTFSLASIYLYFVNHGSKRIIIFLTSLEDCGAMYQDICIEYGSKMKEITQVIKGGPCLQF